MPACSRYVLTAVGCGLPARSQQGMKVTVMQSSGQFESEFVAFIECDTCGWETKADCWHDPELSSPYGFTCTECGTANRFELEDDPDIGRDD